VRGERVLVERVRRGEIWGLDLSQTQFVTLTSPLSSSLHFREGGEDRAKEGGKSFGSE
jgi:hypothetical protein